MPKITAAAARPARRGSLATSASSDRGALPCLSSDALLHNSIYIYIMYMTDMRACCDRRATSDYLRLHTAVSLPSRAGMLLAKCECPIRLRYIYLLISK